jgi:hypothetical protein
MQLIELAVCIFQRQLRFAAQPLGFSQVPDDVAFRKPLERTARIVRRLFQSLRCTSNSVAQQ